VENVAFEVVFYLDDGRNFSRSRLDAPRFATAKFDIQIFSGEEVLRGAPKRWLQMSISFADVAFFC
jgi:hypothetical protein